MAVAPPRQMMQAKRAHDALLEAQTLLEEQGQHDIAAMLFHALGMIEERFGFTFPDQAAVLSSQGSKDNAGGTGSHSRFGEEEGRTA